MEAQNSESAARTTKAPRGTWRWLLLFVALGALALGVQTYLLREFFVLLQGDETAVGVGLAAWFIGIAGGAVAASRSSERGARITAGGAAVLLALLGCGGIPCARLGRSLVGAMPGELLALGPSLLLAVALFTLPGACVGAAFVSTAAAASTALDGASRSIGRLYVFEALGSLVAGLLTSVVLIPLLEPTPGVALLIALALLAALPAALGGAIAGRWAIAVVAALAGGIAVSPVGTWIEQTTEAARFATLAVGSPFRAAKNTPYQHLAMGGAQQRVLYSNGQFAAAFPDPSANELLAHELMLFAQQPSRVLNFGGLETGLLRFCLTHPVMQLDIVLLDPTAMDFVARYLDPQDRAALADPRVHLIYQDPRRFLERGTLDYDLVLSIEPDPATLFLARTTSVEFHRLVRARLAPGGAYVTRFSAGANVQAGETGRLGSSLYRTLHAVFPIVRATPGPDAFFVAGRSRKLVTVDSAELDRRYRERSIKSEFFVPELLPELLPAERVAAVNGELEQGSASLVPATDDRPVAFRYALGVRQLVAGSAWATLLQWSSRHACGIALAVLLPSIVMLLVEILVLFAAKRRSCSSASPAAVPRRAAWHATAVAGASGLSSSLLLFVSFQTRVGALYSELGALSGLFMVGLAAGGFTVMRDRRPQPLLRAQRVGAGVGAFLVVVLGLVAYLPSVRPMLWLLHVVLLLSAGFGAGLVFPAAGRELCANDSSAGAGQVASSLELSDYAGATIAALFSAVVLFPALGLLQTARLLLVLQLVALAATWLASKRPERCR